MKLFIPPKSPLNMVLGRKCISEVANTKLFVIVASTKKIYMKFFFWGYSVDSFASLILNDPKTKWIKTKRTSDSQ